MKREILFGLLLIIASPTYSAPLTHEQVINSYLSDLQAGDYKHIVSLFETNGVVFSTSEGKVSAKDFFYEFLPKISGGKTQLQQLYLVPNLPNQALARFQFGFSSNGWHEGVYIDEFIFSEKSDKLKVVYMFENPYFLGKTIGWVVTANEPFVYKNKSPEPIQVTITQSNGFANDKVSYQCSNNIKGIIPWGEDVVCPINYGESLILQNIGGQEAAKGTISIKNF